MKKSTAKTANKLWVKAYKVAIKRGYNIEESSNRADNSVIKFLERAQTTANYLGIKFNKQ